ncbi:hypothetical protein SAMN04488109_4778 [Chryseolinea serpens]|uniref:Uncharacterized protein n=1 Tax=Chryseolinea serpens TaxID=947013 RepID=A0A1M5UN42_9BACT|nr:hypothetical protein SAMN04488109_4778 [Chryseolinea serpens]
MPYYPDEMGDKLEDKVFCYSIQWDCRRDSTRGTVRPRMKMFGKGFNAG